MRIYCSILPSFMLENHYHKKMKKKITPLSGARVLLIDKYFEDVRLVSPHYKVRVS